MVIFLEEKLHDLPKVLPPHVLLHKCAEVLLVVTAWPGALVDCAYVLRLKLKRIKFS